jgi:hypothetical protein
MILATLALADPSLAMAILAGVAATAPTTSETFMQAHN